MGTNLPGVVADPDELDELEDGLGDADAAEAVSMVALYTTAPATPPTNIDPATAAARTLFRIPFTFRLLVGDRPEGSVAT